MALTKAEMAERLFEEVGLNKREAKEFVDAFFDALREALESESRPVARRQRLSSASTSSNSVRSCLMTCAETPVSWRPESLPRRSRAPPIV